MAFMILRFDRAESLARLSLDSSKKPITRVTHSRRGIDRPHPERHFGSRMKLPTPVDVPGLSLIENYLSAIEQERLLLAIDSAPWSTELRRRVQHYGRVYEYTRRAVATDVPIEPLPDWADALAERLRQERFFTDRPTQVIVNEYLPGQGISAHIDRTDAFGPVVASISLSAATTMDFKGAAPYYQLKAIRLEPCSLLVLRDEARMQWKHGIAARKSDLVGERRVARARRVSITFRTLRAK